MDKRIIGIAQRSLGMHLTGNYKREEIIKEMKSLYSGTDEDRITFLMDKIIEIYESLIQAITDAYGNPDFVKKEMYFMTVIEFLSVLSTNDILFIYKGDRVEEKTEDKLTEEDLKNIDELVKQENKLIEKEIEDNKIDNKQEKEPEVIISEKDKEVLKNEYIKKQIKSKKKIEDKLIQKAVMEESEMDKIIDNDNEIKE